MGAELFHADGQTGGNDEADGRFSQFCESAQIVFRLVISIFSEVSECVQTSHVGTLSTEGIVPLRALFCYVEANCGSESVCVCI